MNTDTTYSRICIHWINLLTQKQKKAFAFNSNTDLKSKYIRKLYSYAIILFLIAFVQSNECLIYQARTESDTTFDFD